MFPPLHGCTLVSFDGLADCTSIVSLDPLAAEMSILPSVQCSAGLSLVGAGVS